MSDKINPDYYRGKVECIEAIEAAVANLSGLEAFCTGNAIKYLYRWKQKNGREDLEKAKWYIDRMLGPEEPVPAPPRASPFDQEDF